MSVQVSVESLSKCSWNGCPNARGIRSIGRSFRNRLARASAYRCRPVCGGAIRRTSTLGEGHVFGFQAQAFTAGLEQRAQYLWPNGAVRHFQYPGVRIRQSQSVDVRGALIVLVEQVQVGAGAGAVVDEQRLEMLARHIALELLVICQVFGRMFGDVRVDVLRRLLAADAKALHQVARGQPAFPPGNGLDQVIAKCHAPAYSLDGLLAFHTLSMCAITLPV